MDRRSSVGPVKSMLGKRNKRYSQSYSNVSEASSGNSGMVLRSNLTCSFKRKTGSNLGRFSTTNILSSFRSQNSKCTNKTLAVKSLFRSSQSQSLVDISGFKELFPIQNRQNLPIQNRQSPKIVVTDLTLGDFDDPLTTTSRSEEEFFENEKSVVASNDCNEKSRTKNVNFAPKNETTNRLLTLLTEYEELKRAADLKWMQVQKEMKKMNNINNKENQINHSSCKSKIMTYSDEKLASIYTPNCKTPDQSVKIKSVSYTPRSLLKRLSEQIEDLNQT